MLIKLEKFGKKHLDRSRGWMNDKELCRLFNRHFKFLTVAKQKDWYKNLLKDKTQLIFAIIVDGVYVGNVGLKNIDKENKKAEYYIFIGDTNYRGKGIGLEGTIKLLDYAKKSLKLHKIYLHVDATNFSAIRLYSKIGFKKEGLLCDELFLNGKFVSMFRMAFFLK